MAEEKEDNKEEAFKHEDLPKVHINEEHIFSVEAIPASGISTDKYYALTTVNGYIISRGSGDSSNNCYLINMHADKWHTNFAPIRFSVNPVGNYATLTLQPNIYNGDKVYTLTLAPNPQKKSNWNDAVWSDSSTNKYPVAQVTAVPAVKEEKEQHKPPKGYVNFQTNNGMVLGPCGGQTPHKMFFFPKDEIMPKTRIAFGLFYISRETVIKLIQAEWPSATINPVILYDAYYEAIDDSYMKDIYNHRAAGMIHKYKKEIFDCDDFAFVAKGD
eukprot:190493_1